MTNLASVGRVRSRIAALVIPVLVTAAIACSGDEDNEDFLATNDTSDTDALSGDGGVDDPDGISTDATDVDPNPVCGDDVAEGSEACDRSDLRGTTCADLGFTSGTLGCTDDCSFDSVSCSDDDGAMCGDGVAEGDEACDEEDLQGASCDDEGFDYGVVRCTDTCTTDASGCADVPVCGDGLREGGEACDDGNGEDEDGCSADCFVEECGDDIVQPGLGEDCEAGAIVVECPGGGFGVQRCVDCGFETEECPDTDTCGDGELDLGEGCDDGNTDSGDGCSATCTSETCGDETVQAYEACDGEDLAGFGCADFGFSAGEPACASCTVDFTTCRQRECGDGIVDEPETCDDGNTDSGDGCSRRCRIEEDACPDGEPQPTWPDVDGDGFGDADASPVYACSVEDGFADSNTDCNDSDSGVNPGAGEDLCGMGDEDCDGAIDEDATVGETCVVDGASGPCAPGVSACEGTDLVCQPSVDAVDEVCDGVDNNCDGEVDNGDLCPVGEVCSEGVCDVECIGMSEICDGMDNDCDDAVDEDFDLAADVNHCGACGNGCSLTRATATCEAGACAIAGCESGFDDCNGLAADGCEAELFADRANCGGCGQACTANNAVSECVDLICEIQSCAPGYIDANADPSDGCETGACEPSNGGEEVCDGVDNDCDGEIDNSPIDAGGSCATGLPGICAPGMTVCEVGALRCVSSEEPTTEVCGDGLDNNCSGVADEGCCGNGLIDSGETCDDGNVDDGDGCSATCSLEDVECEPSGPEVCDDVDNDCDTRVDENATSDGPLTEPCYDGEPATAGVGVCRAGVRACDAGTWGICEGQVLPSEEVCDDFIDNNCNSETDEDCSVGMCSPGAMRPCYTGPAGTEDTGPCRAGTETCQGDQTWGPCEGDVVPVTEICDDMDNDCDSIIDEDVGGVACNTGLSGVCTDGLTECAMGMTECIPLILPGEQTEICDGVDNDCDEPVDEDSGTIFYRDGDGDGWGSPDTTTQACSPPGGYVANSGDCDDSADFVYPGAPELCDMVDNNCIDGADEGFDLDADASNCGFCGNVCSDATNGTGACFGGTCGLTCDSGWDDCNLEPGDGCETDLSGSVTNCGSCGNFCDSTNGTAFCAGDCGISCDGGFDDCNVDPSDGCETSIGADPFNCGGCGVVCSAANVLSYSCDGACGIGACAADFHDVNGQFGDGCEYNCTVTGTEMCDGTDNDCNGVVDDGC